MNQAIEEEASQSESEDEDGVDTSGFNHADLFHEERGRARVAQGDEGYEEEMGGESQMIQVATKMACENFESDSTDGEEEVVEVRPPKKEPVLHCVDEEGSDILDPSSVKSSGVPPVWNADSNAEGRKSKVKEEVCSDDDRHMQQSLSKPSEDNKHCEKENSSSLSAEDTPPITQPSAAADRKNLLPVKPKSRSKVSIMGVVFEDSKASKGQKKKSGLYIPSYTRTKKS